MFGVGYVEVVLAGAVVALGIVLLRVGGATRWVRVDDTRRVALPADVLEEPVTRLLSNLPATQLRAVGPLTWTLVVRRAEWWTILPAILLFPVGLLFLLFREEGSLVITIRPVAEDSEVLVVGTSRLSVGRALGDAFNDLPQPRTTAPRGR